MTAPRMRPGLRQLVLLHVMSLPGQWDAGTLAATLLVSRARMRAALMSLRARGLIRPQPILWPTEAGLAARVR